MFSFKSLRPSKTSNKTKKMRTKKYKGGNFLNKAAVPLTLLGIQSFFNKNMKKVGLTRKFKHGVSNFRSRKYGRSIKSYAKGQFKQSKRSASRARRVRQRGGIPVGNMSDAEFISYVRANSELIENIVNNIPKTMFKKGIHPEEIFSIIMSETLDEGEDSIDPSVLRNYLSTL